MEENEIKQGFKVKDRRRFDSSGNEIPGQADEGDRPRPAVEVASNVAKKPEPPPRQEPSKSAPLGEQSRAEEPRRAAQPREAGGGNSEFTRHEPEDDNPITFASFVMSLATQALMLLGEIKAPNGAEIPVDPEAAKQTIDILDMIEKKTRGNLDAEEKHLIEEILHSLRMSYVRRGHLG